MAQRYHLSQGLDMIIIQKVFSHLGKDWCQQNRLTVNLSIQSVNHTGFHQWLNDIVSNNQQQAKRLMIEISEQQYQGNSEQYIRFLDWLRPHGVHFSIDQFGINSTAFGFLQGLKLDQLKIDGSYINKLHQDRDNQFFLRSLTDIAHNLEIKIGANFVEAEDELKSVLALGMDGAQGYHIGKPESQG
jgi:EAL domain-containing protein (putative c-di-GMP-specific phosphodiesterase class I)